MDESADEPSVSAAESTCTDEALPGPAVVAQLMPQVVTIPDNRDDMNGHSSPDSGVNDMSDDRLPNMVIAAGEPLMSQKVEHKVSVLPNQTMKIRMSDSTRYINGE